MEDSSSTDGGCSMPEHVVFEILLWLPVISLLRFKTVCKSWLARIESSTFITQRIHLHSGKGALLAFYRHKNHFRLLSGNKYEVYTVTELEFEDEWYKTIGHGFDMVDSCNGIICLHNRWTGDVVLWNPALKQLRHVPKPSVDQERRGRYATNDLQHHCIGFGYDAKTKDYKVVRVIWYWKSPDNQVEVYNLRSSSWKVIHKNNALPFTFIDAFSGVHATSRDGICYWAGGGEDMKINLLVSFDLKDEVFKTMSLPYNQHNDSPHVMDFLNDKLVYIKGVDKAPSDTYIHSFEIWMLHEFGVNESWNKTHKIGPLSSPEDRLLRITGFSKNGDMLVVPRHRPQLHWYNLVTREIHPLTNEDFAEVVGALHYNESLVPIKVS